MRQKARDAALLGALGRFELSFERTQLSAHASLGASGQKALHELLVEGAWGGGSAKRLFVGHERSLGARGDLIANCVGALGAFEQGLVELELLVGIDAHRHHAGCAQLGTQGFGVAKS